MSPSTPDIILKRSVRRRDLLQRTHHGLAWTPIDGLYTEAYAHKRAIARWAAAQVQPGETVLLDAGSTVGALARELRTAKELTVATTGLTALHELADVETVHVECLGGTLRPLSQAFVGPLTEAALERMTFDRVFLSADGVTADGGICEADLRQTRLKELMARRATHT
jgi:DeoR/GlpR family transcriptional regulator of sugar metabolism